MLVGRARRGLDPQWLRSTAISPALARRLGLPERLLEGSDRLRRSPLERRLRNLLPARSFGGAIWAELGASVGVEVRDPTADPRVIMFALSVPDRIFIDPDTGVDRWLIREAMRGRLPDKVRLNPHRGRQAGDLVPRLRAHAAEVQATLDELSAGPAPAYIDVQYMRDVWGMVRREDTPEAFRKATTVLMRGIMAGLYVNSLESPRGFGPAGGAR